MSPFFYKNSTFFKKVKLISTSSKKFYISHKGLCLLKKSVGSSVYIISTDRGLLTHQDCIKANIGGIILCGILL